MEFNNKGKRVGKKKVKNKKKQDKAQLLQSKSSGKEPTNSIAVAVKLHQSGRLNEAQTIYNLILKNNPNHIDALHLLGVAEYQVRNYDKAIDFINRAIAINPSIPAFHNNLGSVFKEQGALGEAIKCFTEALRLNPDYVEAYNNTGNVFKDKCEYELAINYYKKALDINPNYVEAYCNLGNIYKEYSNFGAAIEFYQKAIQIKPDFAEAYHNLANTFKECGEHDKAIENYLKAIQLKKDFASAHNNLGNAYKEQGNTESAIEQYKKAIKLEPNYVEAHNNIGNALREHGKLAAAVEHFRKAIEIKPDCAEALNNLGNVFKESRDLDTAIEYYLEAVKYKPNLQEAFNNLGNAYKDQMKLDEAISQYKKAIEIKPDYADAHYNKSLVLLMMGLFKEGLSEYEWRFQSKEVSHQIGRRSFEQPEWDGSSLTGKTILVYSEQGFGDTIQFVRYLTLVKARGGYVVFLCQRALLGLLESFSGIDLLIEGSDSDNLSVPFDVHVSLMSLPRIFGVTPENILDKTPYLRAKPGLIKEWSNKVRSKSFKVGLVWAGNPLNKNDKNRSCTLSDFKSLLSIPNITIFSLQKDINSLDVSNQLKEMAIVDLGEQLNSFADTAALISNLDLVISVDTAIVHLAGALGKPVWTLIPFLPDWRWMLTRSDTPWYPSMRLFRQHQAGDWNGVIERIAVDLNKLVVKQTTHES